MSLIVEVRFAHEQGALAATFELLPEAEVTVIRETSTGPSESTYFLRFELDRREALERAFEADETVQTAKPVSASGGYQVVSVEFSERARLLNPVVTNEGGFVMHARRAVGEPEGFHWHERWLLPDHESLYSVWQRAGEQGFDFEVLDFQSLDGELSEYSFAQALTTEQREALTLAHRRGYFAEPRETSLEELADELGISPSEGLALVTVALGFPVETSPSQGGTG